MQAPKSTNEVFRIFVGGLSFDVDNHLLKESFQNFGNLKKALVIRDQRTGQSKGYGFVTFCSRSSFEAALHTTVYILGRLADCHPVLTKGALKDQEQRDIANKIFVGGVSQAVTAEDLTKYFSRFGRIKDARILYDGKTAKSRGFGFVLFERASEVDAVMAVEIHKIKRKPVEVKRFNKETDLANPHFFKQSPYQDIGTDQFPNSDIFPTHEKKKQTKQKCKKAQRTKITSFESLSTISEKEYHFTDVYQDFNDVQPRTIRHEHWEELQPEGQYQSHQPLAESKPNFTLSGFFSYSQSFEPFGNPLPLSQGNILGTRNGYSLPFGSSWYCPSNPVGPAWTPAMTFQERSRQSRPVPIGNYKY